MSRQLRRQTERKLRKIKIVGSDIKLTAASGLGTILEIFDQSPWAVEFKACLPERVSHRSTGSYLLALMVMAGHIHGVDSLSDLSKIKDDPYIAELFEDEPAAIRTIGDFLQDFTEEHINKLNVLLNNMSRDIMEHLKMHLEGAYKPEELILDMDSTHHVHYGNTIEGLAWNYKNEWCLESQVVFNQLGLCHGVQLRSGNTKSGVDAAPFLARLMTDGKTQRERRLDGKHFFRADSAYCNQEVIKQCLNSGLNFTLTANKATTQWDRQLKSEVLKWEPWVYSKEFQDRAAKSGKELPKCEVARFHWEPSWAEGTLKLPILIKRTWVTYCELNDKSKYGQRNLFELDTVKEVGEWEHYAIVTNFDLTKWSYQEVFEHHQKRGNSENFHKEEKYNFNLKNFPCRRLLSNHAWVLLAQIAHNMIRWIAHIERPDRPHYSKKIRNRFIFSPGKLVNHARQVILKVSHQFLKEVQKLREGLRFPETMPARKLSTANSG